MADTVIVPERYRPVLKEAPLTFSERLVAGVSAARMLMQDVRQALPQVTLTARVARRRAGTYGRRSGILLGSQNPDLHFVVEIDNDRRAHLRFGDDEWGSGRSAGTVFRCGLPRGQWTERQCRRRRHRASGHADSTR